MELLLIRHGQSEADLLGVHEGRADYPLTVLGVDQAKLMAQYVETYHPPEVILTSPLKRAKRTAFILREAIGCDLIEEVDLKEFNNGVLAGLPKEDALIKYPPPKLGRPLHVPIQEGESELEFRFRAERVLSKILHDYQGYKRVAVISHGGLISNLIKAFLQQPIQSRTAFVTGDTGIHLLEVREDLRIIRFLNNQEHLQELN